MVLERRHAPLHKNHVEHVTHGEEGLVAGAEDHAQLALVTLCGGGVRAKRSFHCAAVRGAMHGGTALHDRCTTVGVEGAVTAYAGPHPTRVEMPLACRSPWLEVELRCASGQSQGVSEPFCEAIRQELDHLLAVGIGVGGRGGEGATLFEALKAANEAVDVGLRCADDGQEVASLPGLQVSLGWQAE